MRWPDKTNTNTTMQALPNPRRTRFTAVVMLLVWLLTLATGVVNACQLHEDHEAGGGGLAHGTLAAAAGIDARIAVPAVATPATQQADHDQIADTIACRALCATVQSAVPKQQPLVFADQASDLVLVTGSGPSRVLPGPVAVAPGTARVPRPEPPVFIRFLRLTL